MTSSPARPPAAGEDEDEEDDDDDFLYAGGAGTASSDDADDDDDDDFLNPRASTPNNQAAAGQTGQLETGQPGIHPEDMSVDEWWNTEFLRLSLRLWFWIVIGLFITFILAITTHEVMKAYKLGPYAPPTTTSVAEGETEDGDAADPKVTAPKDEAGTDIEETPAKAE
jgi:hypothetical protein